MQRLNISMLSIAMVLTLAGCFDSDSTESIMKTEPMEVSTEASLSDTSLTDGAEPVQEEGKLTLELAEQALKTQGIKLGSKHRSGDWVLNGVQAMMYTISEKLQDDSPLERISVYVYRSEEERENGLRDYKLQAEKYNMQVPNIYELENVLLLYWHRESLDNASGAQYAQEIRNALDQLSERKTGDNSDSIGVVTDAEKTKRDESHGAVTLYIKGNYGKIYGGTYTSLEGEKVVLLTEITPELEFEIHARSRYPITLKKAQYTEQQLEEAKQQLSAFKDLLELQGVGLDVENNRVSVTTISATAPEQAESLLGDVDPSIFQWKVSEHKAVYEPLK